ncbi:MAG TPA: oligopeptide/dipeptide ABC transporter ATP-binding protein [Acidimicrobiia bacterium]|jgi:peptide/nickel transport system ATP-binding protein|nr:oligopeptide/dipeptide ABC transporter ATP-binding protein [Acidimicrobiia bacterium]
MTAEAPVKTKPLVDVKGLRKLFPISRGLFRAPTDFVHAVDGIDFEIAPGESLGLVGESGCGKSTTGRMLVKLLDPTEGQIKFSDGDYEKDVARVGRSEIKDFRSRVQMIFQDPYESMNPRRTVFDTVSEPLAVQGVGTVPEREERVLELLHLVGLTPAENFLFRYPHELSGGQRQRVAIARALVMNPRFVVADEPTSMLDVSIRISIMELMTDLAERLGVSYLYITHDLAVARYMCDRIAVMYLGKMVEVGPTEDVLANPRHPYTRALLSAVPVPDPSIKRTPVEIKGGISKAINPAPECRFIERCPFAAEVCRENPHPEMFEVGDQHFAACYRINEI